MLIMTDTKEIVYDYKKKDFFYVPGKGHDNWVSSNLRQYCVHLLIKVPPKIAISVLMGTLKGKSAMRVFNQFQELKQRPYWGNHFWAEG